jgi:multiple sugar transport system ATP-binding protein
MPGLELVRLSKSYGRLAPAVREVSLRIEDGELLVLVGPSGCGKSTLLRMIAGLEPVTEGEIRIGERVVNDVAPRDRDIAMVFQNYALYPHMTVFENLAFGLRRRKTPRPEVERRVREIAEMLGLVPHLARKPRELSGGERQRVALGRAMARHPQVFLFDEPLSNLDAQLRGQMRVEIKRLHQRVRATMIYVTHDQVEAMTLGDRIAVLKGGVLQQVADPFTLYRRPVNQFVAGFIGSPPINLFTATVRGDGPPALDVGGVTIPLSVPLAAALAARRGGTVRVGVRAEDLTLARGEPGGAIEGRVELSEPLGGEALVHWSTSAGRLISRVAGKAPATGETATLHFAHSRIHLFDPETEKALDGADAS